MNLGTEKIAEHGEWNISLTEDNHRRKSELCKAKCVDTEWYRRWCKEIGEYPRYHRKQWEFVYVLQSLWERGCIEEGKRGLGFAVGSEPIPSVLAKHGCHVVATDIQPEKGIQLGWDNGNQLCFGIDSLNQRGICEDEMMRNNVTYRSVDMNKIPSDLRNFDFNWSSCSFEHLGSIKKGLDFLKAQLQTLKPGGWAVHTTEFNISSNDVTQDYNGTVIFRMKDIEKLKKELTRDGHHIEELDYSLGGLPEDFNVDIFPHKQDVHIKLQLNEYVVTSIGLLIQKRKKSFFNF